MRIGFSWQRQWVRLTCLRLQLRRAVHQGKACRRAPKPAPCPRAHQQPQCLHQVAGPLVRVLSILRLIVQTPCPNPCARYAQPRNEVSIEEDGQVGAPGTRMETRSQRPDRTARAAASEPAIRVCGKTTDAAVTVRVLPVTPVT